MSAFDSVPLSPVSDFVDRGIHPIPPVGRPAIRRRSIERFPS